MTRLKTDDIREISAHLKKYDRELIQRTGRSLGGIACHALGFDEKGFFTLIKNTSVAVIPVSSGQGVIQGFSPIVRDILAHLGFDAFVTRSANVSGIAEAVKEGANILMMADDLQFITLSLKSGYMVNNSDATARGFVAGLDLMAGGLEGQKVLVIGCGPVGRSAVSAALQRGARVSVFDRDTRLSQNLVVKITGLTGKTVRIWQSINPGDITSCGFDLIVDATNTADVIHEDDITQRTFIAAPGMPLGLTSAAVQKVSNRLLHDPLQLGVAVMAVETANQVVI